MCVESLTEKIRDLADATGIDALGFARADEFRDYVLCGSRRRDPHLALQDAKTIIVAGIYIGGVTLRAWSNSWYGRTSRLYLSEFFADVIEPLKPLVLFLENKGYQAVICDSSDGDRSVLPLKLAAVRAGLGWQGKHSLLISKKFGTFLALGGIITNALLEHNTRQEANHCGNCDKCQKACPVNALDRSYKLTRGKCLSYLMQVEHLSEEAPDAMANRVADCEICQDVCPWNRKHIAQPLATKLTVTFQKKIRDWERFFYLPDLVKMSEQEYIQSTDKLRAGIPYDLFRRNVRIALRNAAKGG